MLIGAIRRSRVGPRRCCLAVRCCFHVCRIVLGRRWPYREIRGRVTHLTTFSVSNALLVPSRRLNRGALSALTQLHRHSVALAFTAKHRTLRVRRVLKTLSLSTCLVANGKAHIRSLRNRLLRHSSLPTSITRLILCRR